MYLQGHEVRNESGRLWYSVPRRKCVDETLSEVAQELIRANANERSRWTDGRLSGCYVEETRDASSRLEAC